MLFITCIFNSFLFLKYPRTDAISLSKTWNFSITNNSLDIQKDVVSLKIIKIIQSKEKAHKDPDKDYLISFHFSTILYMCSIILNIHSWYALPNANDVIKKYHPYGRESIYARITPCPAENKIGIMRIEKKVLSGLFLVSYQTFFAKFKLSLTRYFK